MCLIQILKWFSLKNGMVVQQLQVRLHTTLDGSLLAHAIQVPMGPLLKSESWKRSNSKGFTSVQKFHTHIYIYTYIYIYVYLMHKYRKTLIHIQFYPSFHLNLKVSYCFQEDISLESPEPNINTGWLASVKLRGCVPLPTSKTSPRGCGPKR